MVAIVWDAAGEKRYEGGIDHAVLYVGGTGFAWNGLTSVDDVGTDSVVPVHIDGYKIRGHVSIGDYEGVLTAYTYPEEFLACEGLVSYPGMYVTHQSPKEFSLAYRTFVGDDIRGQESSYKIHILYNLIAIADTKTYETFSASPEPVEFSWSLSGRPEEAVGFRPSVHFIIDSSQWDPARLDAFEDMLYGSVNSDPTLPVFKELVEIIDPRNSLVIIDHKNGEWSAIDLMGVHVAIFDAEIFSIDSPTVIMVDADTFDISTYTY